MPRGLHLAATALVFSYIALLGAMWWAQGHPWFIEPTGLPAPQDFIIFRVAATMALEGRAAEAYQLPLFAMELEALVGQPGPFLLNWPYPPSLTLILVPFALLPYGVAFIAWVVATGGCLAAVMWTSPALRQGIVFVFAAPASLAVVAKGQNSFLSAALMTGFLVMMDRKPWVSGVFLGLLTYKPHLGAVIPLLLIVMRRWDIILPATATALAFAGLSMVALGPAIWVDFLWSVFAVADNFMTPETALPAMQTVYASAAMMMGKVPAGLLHAITLIAATLAVIRVLRAGPDPGTRAAAIIAVSLLAPPYAFQHDGILLVVAGAFLLGTPSDRPWRWEAALVTGAVLLPGLTLFMSWGPPGPLAAITILLLAMRRAGLLSRVAAVA